MFTYHGHAIAINDIQNHIKKDDVGLITAYLPEDNTFAVLFENDKWYTFHTTEKMFLETFDVRYIKALENVDLPLPETPFQIEIIDSSDTVTKQ